MNKLLTLLLFLVFINQATASTSLEEAEALLNAMNAKEQYAVAASQVQQQFGLDAEQYLQFSTLIYSEMARIYSEVYTHAELRGIRQFYESEAGKAFLDKKPQLTEKYMGVLNKLVTQVSE